MSRGDVGGGRWVRWVLAPWRSPLTVAALIIAASVPAYLVATATGWRAGAEDQLTAQVVTGASLRTHGLDVRMEVRFQGEPLLEADTAVRSRIRGVPSTEPPTFTMHTLPLSTSTADGDTLLGPSRLLAREGALDAVAVVEAADHPRDGVWVSSWFAERHGLSLGDRVTVQAGLSADVATNDTVPGGGVLDTWTITAIYETLWDESGATPGGYWDDVPRALLPRYLPPFDGPDAALFLADPDLLAGSGLTGIVRWEAPATTLPDTLAELRTLASAYRELETDLVTDPALTARLDPVRAPSGGTPALTTELFDALQQAEAAAAEVRAPVRSGLLLGLILSTVVVGAAGAVIVEQRRSEFRLLAAEGERWLRLGARTAAQTILPAGAGAVVGTALARVTVMLWGPGEPRWGDPVQGLPLLVIVAAVVVAVSGLAGLLGQRTLEVASAASRRVVQAVTVAATIAVISVSVLLWFQTGGESDRLDVAAVALPVTALAAVTIVGLGLLAIVLARLPVASVRRHPVVGLARRRLQQPSSSRSMGALGAAIGFGLLMISATLVDTLDRSATAKLATQVGGVSRATIPIAEADLALPAGTTLLRSQDTRSIPDGLRLRVVAIDRATVRDGVSWPSAFGLEIDEALARLDTAGTTAIPALAISGEATPDRGAFGSGDAIPFEVVARLDSLPLAGEFGVTILVDAERVSAHGVPAYEAFVADELAGRRRRAEALAAEAEAAGEPFDVEAHLEAQPPIPPYVPPTARFRHHLVSQLDEADLQAAIGDVTVRDWVTTQGRRVDPNLVGVRIGFDYLSVVGAVAVVLALTALSFHLAARRRRSALSTVMAKALGVPRMAIVVAGVAEIVVLILVGVVAGTFVIGPVAGRLFSRFDPVPGVPPDVGAAPTVVAVVGLAAGLLVIGAAVAALNEWRDVRRRPAEVLRELR